MSLVDRAKNIIMSPKTEWEVIANEQADMGSILTGYVIPMALIPAVASFIGYGFIGVGVFSTSITWGIAYALISLFSTILGVLLTAFVVNLLAPSFNSEKDLGRAMQLVAYAYTPAWVGGILNILPVIGWLGGLFGLYGIYLMYLGFPHTMKTPQDKVIIYMIVAVVILIVLYMILAAIITSIIFSIFGLGIMSMLG
ncbi:MAG: YIP1 family protein [Bacteroidetes bacterium]|nr:YIP1 family protein [Bacteroidota bacterium]